MKKIVYISNFILGLCPKEEEDDSRCLGNKIIIKELQKYGDLIFFSGLDTFVEKIRGRLEPKEDYHAIITNCRVWNKNSWVYELEPNKPNPPVGDCCSRMYALAVKLIAEIHREFPESRLIVYTGADRGFVSDERLFKEGACSVVRKGAVQDDAFKLKRALS